MATKKSALTEYLSGIGRKGGTARGKKYDKKTLSEWGRKGGRPKKGGKSDSEGKESQGRV